MEFFYIEMYVFVFMVGSSIASFLNVVIWRAPQGISFVKGRSFCPVCHHQLKWYDLCPIFSYLILRGRCRYCKGGIAVREVVLEALGGCIGMFCFCVYGVSWDTVLVFAVFMILLTITVMDIDTMTIPNGLICSLLVPICLLAPLHPEISLISRCIGIFAVSLPMYLLTRLIPNCFGGGDVKLMGAAGFLLGWKLTLVAFFISVWIGGVYAMYLLATKKAEKGSHIAFGPYLCTGIILSLLYGNSLIHAYVAVLGM